MLTVDDFKKRARRLFDDSRTRWRKKLEKGLPKGVALSIPAHEVLPFTGPQFGKWLWDQLHLQAIPCPYCRTPIDILSLSLDHKTPLRRGGGPELSNLQLICQRCNKVKGEFTHEEFLSVVAFMEGPGIHMRQRVEGVLINGNMGNMLKNFPRKKGDPKKQRVVPQNRLSLELGEF